jgi:PKD domain/Carboxypeptidase regulatory-like domain/Peptidase M66
MTSPRLLRALAVALVIAIGILLNLITRRAGPESAAAHAASCAGCDTAMAAPPPLPEEASELRSVADEVVAPVAEAERDAPPPPLEPALALRQDSRWRAAVPEREFAVFREWTGRFEKATAAQRNALLAEGRHLVEVRRHQMSALIDRNPKRALELAVPVAVRGRGDIWVAAAIPMPGFELSVRATQRTVQMRDGRLFDAFTFGRRVDSPTRMNIAVHGIALDGKLALDELPGRVLEPIEAAEAKGGGEICPESGIPTDVLGEEVAVDLGDEKPLFFCGPAHAFSALTEAADVEGRRLPAIAAAGGDGGDGEPPIAETGYTEGTKKLLIIRVDFPDATGQVVSDGTLTTLIANMKTQWDAMSYGKLTWTALGSGSAFTPTLRLPNGHASYTDFATMLGAARAAAADAGYNYQDYQFDVVVTGSRPSVGFGGIAYVGGRGAWLANSQWNLGVCSHEVGHNFGLNHAGFWDTDDGSPIGAGSAVEYGNPFDHMGGASSSFDAHFGARQKNYLDWLADADVRKIGADGQVLQRISAFDAKAATGFKSIAVDRAGTTNDYWIEYRGAYADTNNSMKEGVVLNWGPYAISNAKPLLLDNTPGTGSLDDSTVLIGRTFSDTAAGIHITPVARGTDAGTSVRWIDVQVNRGAFAGNQKPTVSVGASNLNPAVNGSVTCTATASDPDAGDTLAYFWEWGDGSYTANNSATAAHSWTTTGTKTVRCRVTDMKGQTATGQLLIQVGTSTTFFIQGTVASTAGVPIEGASVKAGSASDTTDSEGYYAITGLAAGSYTMTATKTGLTINPNGFANPVTVGPSKQNINFTAPPGAPNFGAMKPAIVDQGSNSGVIILPVSDPDTAVTALTLTAVSSNTAIIPNASITFGTKGTTVRTVTASAAASVSGVVDITITATDPEGSSASYVWPVTVNAKPVLSTTAQNVVENGSVDIDLRALAADDLTGDDALHFEIARVRGGTAALLADGRTARFTPAPDYHGAASFFLTARDQSLSSRTQFLYDFEPPDTTADGKITDQSNYGRNATFETAGTGGEYSYIADAPGALSPQAVQAVHLTEAGTGGSRIRKTMAATASARRPNCICTSMRTATRFASQSTARLDSSPRSSGRTSRPAHGVTSPLCTTARA